MHMYSIIALICTAIVSGILVWRRRRGTHRAALVAIAVLAATCAGLLFRWPEADQPMHRAAIWGYGILVVVGAALDAAFRFHDQKRPSIWESIFLLSMVLVYLLLQLR
jgi:hypothetical protein